MGRECDGYGYGNEGEGGTKIVHNVLNVRNVYNVKPERRCWMRGVPDNNGASFFGIMVQ